MNLDQIPLMSMLKGKLGYLNDRQKLIAQNVANADTPGYAPKDLKPFTFASAMGSGASGGGGGGGGALGMTPVRTSAAHLPGKASQSGAWKPQTLSDSEARLDGNQVVLEDQMIKMSEARMDYEAAIGLYQKSLGMLRMAVRKPGG